MLNEISIGQVDNDKFSLRLGDTFVLLADYELDALLTELGATYWMWGKGSEEPYSEDEYYDDYAEYDYDPADWQ